MSISIWIFEKTKPGKIVKSTCDLINLARRDGLTEIIDTYEKVVVMRYGSDSKISNRILGSIYTYFSNSEKDQLQADEGYFGAIDLCLYFIQEETNGDVFNDKNVIWKIAETMRNQGFSKKEMFGERLYGKDFSEKFMDNYVYHKEISLQPVLWR
jgi:hypothetical protein